jgi:YfiH family protein
MVTPLADLSCVRHTFFTRLGGVSTGLYASLNCGLGSADDPADVSRNRAICADRLNVPPEALATVFQVHGTTVADAGEPWLPDRRPHADALVCARQGIAIGVLTADCAPVLLADGVAGVIGAAHAGWKGARNGVTDTVVDAMVRLGAARARIVATVGPAIGASSYEVGEEFKAAFAAADPGSARFFWAAAGRRPHFDLQAYVAARLERLGLGRVDRVDADTCAEPDRYFSYRRSCLLGEPDYGRQLSAIALS